MSESSTYSYDKFLLKRSWFHIFQTTIQYHKNMNSPAKFSMDLVTFFEYFQADIYLFKVNNKNAKTRPDICSKLTIVRPERCHWRQSGVFTLNLEQISHIVLVFPLFPNKHVNANLVLVTKALKTMWNSLKINNKDTTSTTQIYIFFVKNMSKITIKTSK